jgi:hypothetical protein
MGPMGPQIRTKKEAILLKHDDFGRLPRFLENICSVGSFVGKLCHLIAPEMGPELKKTSADQSGGLRTHLEVFGDEVSFQYFQKT